MADLAGQWYDRQTNFCQLRLSTGEEASMAATPNWKNSLESLRRDFLDLSRSFPKLFYARLIAPLTPEGTETMWRRALGEQRLLRFGWRPTVDEFLDHACLYAASFADGLMCEHAITRFDFLAAKSSKALSEIPTQLLPHSDNSDVPSQASRAQWLDFVDHFASRPGYPDQTRGFTREQFKVLQPRGEGVPAVRVPIGVCLSRPHDSPPEAFPHRWLAVLSPDIGNSSASVIDELFRVLPDFAADFTRATWIDGDGCRTTWTVPDCQMLDEIKSERGEPDELFEHEAAGVAGNALMLRLQQIPPGHADAHDYHQCIGRIAKRLLHPDLTGMKIEEPLNEGRKVVDLCFDNVAEHGFFYELKAGYQIKCPMVFVECKNYSCDPKNPELDQLAGRFGDQRGLFGILVCRHVEDEEKLLRRCRDFVADRRVYIIVLTDADITRLWALRCAEKDSEFNEYFRDKFKKLIL